MIATAGALDEVGDAPGMGISVTPAELDLGALRGRISGIVGQLETQGRGLLESQGVRIVKGSGRLVDPRTVVVDTEDGELTFEADAVMVSTG
ncbi:MAG: NADPH:quinone reductase, partial [Microthrixaceae bacterium]|nr:NADPH:quinone reductase [Microthrixaceae bacterium]